jgi:hypothetical protein
LSSTRQTHLFKNGKPGLDWYYHFLKRWEHVLAVRKADNISSLRAKSCTVEIVDKYLENCKTVFQQAGIDLTKASFVWNVDETGFSGDQGKVKIVVRRGTKRPLKLSGNNEKTSYTVQNCCNASGFFLPPFVVYKSKNRLYDSWCKGGLENTVYSTSPSG